MKFTKIIKSKNTDDDFQLHLNIVDQISILKQNCDQAIQWADIMSANSTAVGGTLDSSSVLLLLTEFNKKFKELSKSYLKTTTKRK